MTSCYLNVEKDHAFNTLENIESPGYYSCLFLVPKPESQWRPVIGSFLVRQKLKMKTPASVRASLYQETGNSGLQNKPKEIRLEPEAGVIIHEYQTQP